MRESIDFVARQAQQSFRHNSAEAQDTAERLQALAKDIGTAVDNTPQSPVERQSPRPSIAQPARAAFDKAARYNELEQRLRQRDRMAPKFRG
jgi:hypothetical protein